MNDSLKDCSRIARGFLGMSSLWRGKDHLIYVRGKGFLLPLTEEYKRYRFEDIQAISVSKKSRISAAALYVIALLSFAAPLALVLALSADGDLRMGVAVVISFLALGVLLSAGLLLRHLILGPVCVCDLQTSISRDRILSLSRFHAAKQCLDALAPDILKAQRPLQEAAPAEVVEVLDSDRGAVDSFVVPMPVIPTFVGVILLGVGALATLHLESIALTVSMLVALLLVSFSLTFSQVASVRKPTPESVRSILWITMGLLFVFVGTATVYLLIAAARNPVYTLDFMGPLEALTGVASEGGIGFYLMFLLISLSFFACGLTGLLTALRWKRLNSETRAEAAERVPPSPD